MRSVKCYVTPTGYCTIERVIRGGILRALRFRCLSCL
jgi:hypothetical protein